MPKHPHALSKQQAQALAQVYGGTAVMADPDDDPEAYRVEINRTDGAFIVITGLEVCRYANEGHFRLKRPIEPLVSVTLRCPELEY